MLRRVMKSSNRACCYSTFAAAELPIFTDVNAIGIGSPAKRRRHRIKRHFVSIANSVTSPISTPAVCHSPAGGTGRASNEKSPLQQNCEAGFMNNPGSDLLSHTPTHAVPSAVAGLTSVFGMGTGVTLPL